jgi:branched-subunit amino acid transport protein
MEILLIFLGMALVTYFTRYAMIALLGQERLGLSPSTGLGVNSVKGRSLPRRWLAYVPPAVLAALIVPAALAPRGHLTVGPHAWATLAGAVVVWRTRNVPLTILGGMVVFWVLKAVWVGW